MISIPLLRQFAREMLALLLDRYQLAPANAIYYRALGGHWPIDRAWLEANGLGEFTTQEESC